MYNPNKARSGWDKSCIGTGADGRAKVTIEQAELIVAKYAQSDIMEGETGRVLAHFPKTLVLDIAFSTELGNEERKIIHRGAQDSFSIILPNEIFHISCTLGSFLVGIAENQNRNMD